MKKLFAFFLVLILSAFCFFPASASNPLDEIETYRINVSLNPDGTMELVYHIDWKVLDDQSEGPLDWVKIGIPNSNVDNITALSDNISSIDYYPDNGDYVRIDFKNSHYQNEVVSFDFSIHQSYMYTLDYDKSICSYSFTPGWFDEIEVKELKIIWKDINVSFSDAQKTEDGNLVWTAALSPGQKLTANVQYPIDVFETNDSMQYGNGSTYDETSNGITGGVIMVCVILIFIVLFMSRFRKTRNYLYGFGNGFHGGHGGHGGCACVSSCACACACACAGGGRAGCSAKNFYGADIQTDDLLKRLENDRKNSEF